MTDGNDGLAASVLARLLNLSRETAQDYNRLLERYALERFLYRLSMSDRADQFVLKGAMMMVVWIGDASRATRDADLLGYGDFSDDELRTIFKRICDVPVEPDGMRYDAETVTVTEIRDNDVYGGKRITFSGHLGNARLRVQIDVGIGDAVTANPDWIKYPALLDLPPPRLRGYRPETAIAEKLHILVHFGMANTRMKDIFDIAMLATHESFDGDRLASQVNATFERRRTAIPAELPVALTEEFAIDESKRAQWEAFMSRNGLEGMMSLADAITAIRQFAWPVLQALSAGHEFAGRWSPDGSWKL